MAHFFLGWLIAGLFYGLIGGVSFGLFSGFINSGFAVSQYYTLRFFLYRTNCLPWKVVPFIEYCTERLFLNKVGGTSVESCNKSLHN